MTEPVRLGVVGAGTISQLAHLPGAEIAPNVEVVALCDPREGLLRAVADRHYVATTYGAVEGLLADEGVEAVSLCVPTPAHSDLTVRALQHGKHVLCEKPMAGSVRQAQEMLRAAKAHRGRLMIGHHKRYDPGCEQAQAAIAAGLIGTPRLITYTFGTGNWTHPAPRPALSSDEPAPAAAYDHPEGVDSARLRGYYESLLEMFSHMTNLIRWLVGNPDWILAARPARGIVRGTLTLGWGEDGEDTQAFCTDGPHYPANVWNEVLTIWGDEGRAEVTLPQNVYLNKPARVRLFDLRSGCDTELPEEYGWAFAREIEHFGECLRTGVPFRTEAADSLTDVLIAEAAALIAACRCEAPFRLTP